MSLRDEMVAKIGEQVEDAAFYADAIADALMPLVERAVREAATHGFTSGGYGASDYYKGTVDILEIDAIVARVTGKGGL